MYPMTDSPRKNHMLGKLPMAEYACLVDQLEPVDLACGQVIYEPGMQVDHVYFPTTCTASLVSTTEDGEMSELAMTGHDGFVGVPLVLGGSSMNHRVMVLCAGRAWRMNAEVFCTALDGGTVMQKLALCYVQALITQMTQSIVCGRHHSVMERLCYWLLFNMDASCSDELKVTHEMIAHMLGVRRESVTQAAGRLQASGWISTRRGKITVHDRAGLSTAVCECYGLVNAESQRLLARVAMPEDADSVTSSVALAKGSSAGVSHLASTVWPSGRQQDPDLRFQKYMDVYDFAPVGLVTLNADGHVLETNLAGAILLDVPRSQSCQYDFSSFLHEGVREDFEAFHEEVLSGKCRRHCELVLPATDHRTETIVRVHATVDESGQEVRMVLVDITQDKTMMAQAQARAQHQRMLLEQLPQTLWIKDKDGSFVSAGPSLQAHFQGEWPSDRPWAQGTDFQQYVSPALVAETSWGSASRAF